MHEKKNYHNTFRLFKIKGVSLKVPKREIFDRSDFPDFYTLRVGDFEVKIKFKKKKYLGVHLGVRMLSLFLRRFFF